MEAQGTRRVSFYPKTLYFQLLVAYATHTDQPMAQIVEREVQGLIDRLPVEQKNKLLKLYESLSEEQKRRPGRNVG